MPRTKAHREEVTDSAPAVRERKQTPLAIPTAVGHPEVVRLKEQIAETQGTVWTAERRLEEARSAHKAAHDALLQARGKSGLGEVDPEDVDQAATAVEEAGRALQAAQEDLQGKQAAVAILRDRLTVTEERVRQENARLLVGMRQQRIAHIADTCLKSLASEMVLLYRIERAMNEQGISLEPTGPMTIGELLPTSKAVTNENLVFGFAGARLDGLNLLQAWLQRARRLGVEVPMQEVAASLRDLGLES